MDLKDIRAEIDEIDSQLVELLLRRMNCSEEVARYKAENNMPIFNNEREQQIIDKVTANFRQICRLYKDSFPKYNGDKPRLTARYNRFRKRT